MNSFYSKEELEKIGFKSVGENVLISKKSSIYSPNNISIGNNVRIDDFCILSGNIKIGNYVHISAFDALYGGDEGIEIGDFVSLSTRTTIFSISDDYSGEYMANPMIPVEYKNVESKKIIIEKHVIVGTTSVILPGAILREGASCGAFSLIKDEVLPWTINVGIPIKKINDRKKNILSLENKFLNREEL